MKQATRFLSLALAAIQLVGVAPLCADETIGELLRSYRKESDLSRRTKEENAGYVVVYTRDDLERMQIMRLSEILKLNRFLPHRINTYGMNDPIHFDPFFYNSDMVKVYVNDHEITTAFSGSGLQFYGDVDMGMFDHVEVYYNAPMLDVATEPSLVVIKLYTKSPERENGGNLTLRAGIRKSQEVAISHGQAMEDWNYFAYVEESEDNFEHWKNDRVPPQFGTYYLSRDRSRQHLFLDLSRKEQRLEMEYYRQKNDPWTGQTVYLTPKGGNWTQPMGRVSYSGKWLEGKLHTSLSYIRSTLDFDISSFGPFWGQMILPQPPQPYADHDFEMKVAGDLITAKASYEERWFENHLVKFGGIYRYKDAEIKKYRFDETILPENKANMHVGTLYLQDQVSLREDTVFALSAKIDGFSIHKSRSLRDKEETLLTWQGRASMTTIRGPWHLKAFANHVELPTQLYMLVLHDEPLDSQIFDTLSLEIEHKSDRDTRSFYVAYTWCKDIFTPAINDITSTLEDYRVAVASFDEIFQFDEFNSIEFNANLVWLLGFSNPNIKNRTSSGYVRLLNSWGNFDLFNEIAYRENMKYTPRSLGYNVGVRWHPQKDVTLSLKGIDILNRDVQQFFLLPDIPEGGVSVPIVGRQVYVTLEYLF